MNRFEGLFKPLNTLLMALLMAAFAAGCGDGDGGGTNTFLRGNPGPAGASPNIGTAGTYGVFAGADAAVTLAVDSLVDGDVGLMDGAGTCGNCTALTVTGAIENGTPAAQQAQVDFRAAYTDASTRSANACTLADASELANAQGACTGVTPGTPGPVYGPGLYRTGNPILFSGTITLDAGGNANGVFIFQTDAAITTASNSVVLLVNGAQAKNVWWIAGSAATLGVSSKFKGTVIANAAAVQVNGGTAGDRTLVEGRLFSSGAAAGVDAFATVTVPQ